MPRFRLDTAWISSDEQMAAFEKAKKSRSVLLAMFLGLKVPPEMPAILAGRKVMPIIHFASGTLTVDDRRLTFEARDRRRPWRSTRRPWMPSR